MLVYSAQTNKKKNTFIFSGFSQSWIHHFSYTVKRQYVVKTPVTGQALQQYGGRFLRPLQLSNARIHTSSWKPSSKWCQPFVNTGLCLDGGWSPTNPRSSAIGLHTLNSSVCHVHLLSLCGEKSYLKSWSFITDDTQESLLCLVKFDMVVNQSGFFSIHLQQVCKQTISWRQHNVEHSSLTFRFPDVFLVFALLFLPDALAVIHLFLFWFGHAVIRGQGGSGGSAFFFLLVGPAVL